MHQFITGLIEVGMKIHSIGPQFSPRVDLETFSNITIGEILKTSAEKLFMTKNKQYANEIHFVNLLVDAGTVLQARTIHAVLSNPNYPSIVIPFKSEENHNFTSIEYCDFFRRITEAVSTDGFEIAGCIIDNLPAQVRGLYDFFESATGINKFIIHIPCFNQLVNLVFAHLINQREWSPVFSDISTIVSFLRTRNSIETIGEKCPTPVRTRWIYIVEIIQWIYQREEIVLQCLHRANQVLLTEAIRSLYLVLIPLYLFSLVIERKETKLCDVIPILFEMQRQFLVIGSGLNSNYTALINYVTLHFFSRIQSSNYQALLAAFAFSPTGRDIIRDKEKHYLTRGEPPCFSHIFINDSAIWLSNEFNRMIAGRKRGTDGNSGEVLQLLEPENTDLKSLYIEPEATIAHENDDEQVTNPDEIPASQRAFKEELKKEEKVPLLARLTKNLIDGIVPAAEDAISS
jgi:hypothetical protein